MGCRPAWLFTQSGVIPYLTVDGGLAIVLITSRRSGRWIIPKGVIEKNISPHMSAEKEAMEEAGIVGEALPSPVGSYEYQKWGGTCNVEVFPMRVELLLERRPECGQRRRLVVPAAEAIKHIDHPGLRGVMSDWVADYAKPHVAREAREIDE